MSNTAAVSATTLAATDAEKSIIGNRRGRLRLRVVRCSGLIPQDSFSGTSDPYYEVYCGDTKVYRSKTQSNTLCPQWATEGEACNIFMADTEQPIMIMLWDEDVVSSDFLGHVKFVLSRLAVCGEVTMPLQRRLDESDANVMRAGSLGSATLQWSFTPEAAFAVMSVEQPTTPLPDKGNGICNRGTLRLSVEKCCGLVNRFFTFEGSVYLNFLLNGIVVGTTLPAPMKGSDPTWADGSAAIEELVDAPLHSCIQIQLFSKKTLQDSCLGEVTLCLCQMPMTGKQVVSVKPRLGEVDSEILQHQSELGVVHLAWSYADAPELSAVIEGPGTLRLQLVAAKQLLDRDVVGTMEVYGVFTYEQADPVTTPVSHKSQTKQHRFEWERGAAIAELEIVDPRKPITISLLDKDVIHDDFLGQAEFLPSKNASKGEGSFTLHARPDEKDALIAEHPGVTWTGCYELGVYPSNQPRKKRGVKRTPSDRRTSCIECTPI